MLINDLVALLMAIPTTLAAGWGVWFAIGLGLSIWGRREKNRLVIHHHQPMHTPKHKSGPVEVAVAVAVERPHRPAKNVVPHSAGDAFGELAALLEPQEGSHRMPGEAPVEAHHEAPLLAAPRSLP
jgi:hypothetical protein